MCASAEKHYFDNIISGINDNFFEKWPYLQNASALFRDMDSLLGIIDVQEKWDTAL